MKRFILGAIILVSPALCRAISFTFDKDSKQVVVSTTAASPTQILTQTSYVNRTVITNPTAFNLYLSSGPGTVAISTNVAAGGAFFIPPFNAFSPDGPNDPFEGAMWAVLGSTGTVPGAVAVSTGSIGVLRLR